MSTARQRLQCGSGPVSGAKRGNSTTRQVVVVANGKRCKTEEVCLHCAVAANCQCLNTAAGPSADGHEDGAHQPPADDAAADTVEDAPGARAGGPANAGLRKGDGARGDAIMTLPEGTIVADVSVIHPAAQTYIGVAARATGAAAALRDASKVEKYRRSAMGGACEFVPLSVETYGRMGEPAMALLRRLAEVAADGGRVNKQRWMKSALRKLSVALMRGNSWRFKAGLCVGARVAGRSFQAGLVRPAVEGG